MGEVGPARLAKAVVGAADGRLAILGFKKRAGNVFTRSFDDYVVGWLGLNLATGRGDGRLEINPVIGVRHQAVERLIAELHGEKAQSRAAPTISVSLGYVLPEMRYTPWFFADERDVEPGTVSLVAAVESYGIPFMERYGSLSGIVEAARSGLVPVPEQRVERLAVALVLTRDAAAALAELDAFADGIGDRSDPAAARFRSFARALRSRAAGS
jgi:hypothetical protein